MKATGGGQDSLNIRRGVEGTPRLRAVTSGCCRFVAALLVLAGPGFFLSTQADEKQRSDTAAAFDHANKLYYQGFYGNAAVAYQALVQQPGYSNSTVYFNLGNAWFKAGQVGRAIASYRQAQLSAPRDPALRFNLNFARKEVTGRAESPELLWKRSITRLSLNEWTLCATAGFWLCFILLGLRELRPAWRRFLRNYLVLAAAGTVIFALGTAAAAYERYGPREAIVTVPQAVVRYGPFTESQVSHQLRDGSEVTVVDQKSIGTPVQAETWLQIRDASGRVGWLRDDQVTLID